MAGYYGNEKATAESLRDGWLYTGDLGRLDEDGNLYIVGRSKELIVDHNGKNVYPDELEELYANEDLIEELAVIGLPDGVSEQVAVVVVPKRDSNEADVEKKIEAHVQEVSAKLPLYKRVKTLELTDDELPRTATRKVKTTRARRVASGKTATRRAGRDGVPRPTRTGFWTSWHGSRRNLAMRCTSTRASTSSASIA